MKDENVLDKWEYKRTRCGEVVSEEEMNELGEIGWQLVDNSCGNKIWKRRIKHVVVEEKKYARLMGWENGENAGNQ